MKRYRKSPLTKRDYAHLKIALTIRSNHVVSKTTGYSMSTVNLVNRTKDYAEYQSYNRSRRPRARTTTTMGDGYNYTWVNPKEEEEIELIISVLEAQKRAFSAAIDLIDILQVRIDRASFRANLALWTVAGLVILVVTLLSRV